MKTTFILLVLSLFVSCEKDETYYFRSESAKQSDPSYMKMEKQFNSYTEKEKDLLEEIVMERLMNKQKENQSYMEPDDYDGR